jgi:amidase
MKTEAAIALPSNLAAAPSAEDQAFFAQVAQDGMDRLLERVSSTCLDAFTVGRKYPLAEPNYNAKRPIDMSPYSAALDGFTSQRRAELDTLIKEKPAVEIEKLLDEGQLTAVELVTYYADRIRRYDVDKLNSVIELNPDALADAAALDDERKAGNLRGPLHGLPVLLKDNIAAAAPLHTTAGAAVLKGWQTDRDAYVVQKLRAAGAIILGKANLSEWANYMDACMPSGFSAVGGQTRNPYGPYDTLGSSSGSAVSVSANLTALSLGSETSRTA